jgi:L,D-transpeptidase-like protein
MKFFMKLSVISLLLLAATAASAYFFWYKPRPNQNVRHSSAITENKEHEVTFARLKQKSLLAKAYAEDHDYDSVRCFLLDMKLHSGKKRFFVYNLEKDSVEIAGLVTHGTGSDKGVEGLVFSNTPNSNCTSLGKCKVGKSYMGKFGLAYKLYGLDNSNSKAFDRFVVLHSHNCVPNEEIAPLSICESWGCPTVAPAFLKKLKGYIDASPKSILLWIYY